MEQNEKKNLEMRPVLIKLLQGFLTHDNKKLWDSLLLHQDYVRNYFKILGLYLHLNRDDGYAFLKTSPDENLQLSESDEDFEGNNTSGGSGTNGLNGNNNASYGEEESSAVGFSGSSLIRKMPLPFDVSLLLVLLRESLEQFDEKVSDDYRLILKKFDIYEQLKMFYNIHPSGGDEIKLFKKFDSLISKVVGLGFLKELKMNSGTYEVRRSIKAFLNASQLKEMKEKMTKYVGAQNA